MIPPNPLFVCLLIFFEKLYFNNEAAVKVSVLVGNYAYYCIKLDRSHICSVFDIKLFL